MLDKIQLIFFSSSNMNFWTITLYMICCIQVVTSQGDTVFSVSFSVKAQTVYFNFNEAMFNGFYHCLRNKDHTFCDVQRNSQYDVTIVRTCLPVSNSQIKDAFTCRPVGGVFFCKGVNFPPPGVNTSQCTVTYDIRDDASLSQWVRLTWDGVDSVTMENHAMEYGITVDSFGNKIYNISGTFTSKVTTTTTTTVKTTRRTPAPGQSSTLFSQDSSTITTPVPDKQKSEDGGDDSDIAIIIGATVAGVVIVAIIVIIVIILWRRKKRPSSSSTTDNNKHDDTDIYLNSGSTLSNIKPNRNSNEVTYYSNELTPHMHATVEQNKNPNEATPSDSCTANSDHNRSQQKKPQMSPYLNYTEAAIDNDAGLDSLSSSDVNNGQGTTASTPDPSAKATYYNFLS